MRGNRRLLLRFLRSLANFLLVSHRSGLRAPFFMNFPSFYCRQRQAAISAARNRLTARKVVMPDSRLSIIRVFGPQMMPKVIVRRPTGQFDAKGAHEGEWWRLEDRWMVWMGRRRSVGHVALQPLSLLPRRLLENANIDRQINVE